MTGPCVEVFISEKGTWTMLVTDQAGTSCIMAAGDAWDEVDLPKGRRGA